MQNQYTDKFCLHELKILYNRIVRNRSIGSLNSLIEDKNYTTSMVYSGNKIHDDPEIDYYVSKIRDILKHRLIERSCEKKLNSSMAQFVALNTYDFLSERTESKIDNNIKLQDEELQRVADELASSLIHNKKNQVK